MNHQDVKNKWISCQLCDKCQNNRKVFGNGNLKSKIAIVGEGPGREEYESLTPFVGDAGKLLNQILLGVGIKREEVFVTNAILCRTNDFNRTPTQEEYNNCRQRLFEELSIVNPRYTILAGNIALRTVMGEKYQIGKVNGRWLTLLSQPSFLYYAIYHPSWINRSTNEGEKKARKMIMWNDIRKFVEDIRGFDKYYEKI